MTAAPPTSRRFEDVVIGEPLPEIRITLDLAAFVTYAAATWDFHRLHYDPAFAAARGLRTPIMDGQMPGGLLARQLMQWAGPDGFVRRLAFRLREPVFAGEEILLRGGVEQTMVEEGRGLALCRMEIVKTSGGVVVRDATGAVELPRRG